MPLSVLFQVNVENSILTQSEEALGRAERQGEAAVEDAADEAFQRVRHVATGLPLGEDGGAEAVVF